MDPTGYFKWDTYEVKELKILLNEAREKTEFSKKNQNYQVYKDFIWNRYDLGTFMETNQYNYLYDLLTGTSAYKNNAGRASWAQKQLADAFFESKEAEYERLFALGIAVGLGSTKGPGNAIKNIKSLDDILNDPSKL